MIKVKVDQHTDCKSQFWLGEGSESKPSACQTSQTLDQHWTTYVAVEKERLYYNSYKMGVCLAKRERLPNPLSYQDHVPAKHGRRRRASKRRENVVSNVLRRVPRERPPVFFFQRTTQKTVVFRPTPILKRWRHLTTIFPFLFAPSSDRNVVSRKCKQDAQRSPRRQRRLLLLPLPGH